MFSKLFGSSKKETAPAKASAPPQRPASGGGARAPPPPPAGGGGGGGTSQVIQRMDDTIESMDLREQLLIKKIDQETQKAKDALAKKNKNLAILCMKRKKMYENNLEKLMAQRGNMETIKITMEDTAMTQQILQTQRHAASELERLNAGMEAEKVEEDLDRLRDAMDQQKEIQELLSQQVGTDIVDEDELLEELDELVAADKKAVKAATKVNAPAPAQKLPDMGPSVPTSKIAPAKTTAQVEEDDELARLEAEMNA